ncbi:ABC transporter ATP-binding protein [Sutcliffiella sp. NC1]|uniref:ABC transporter ATP-binding protein n=1 Tax=Sutcliffiella sp. NC1 TaxID=3004096 RepID=UPI0022DD0F9F|nr:ABC transporter ATP-binding protein [Sutcliffiella sp. NC1]WBL14653.1 ABC transporter ATP-binding protein [Sutcliffiella sp. NC1]
MPIIENLPNSITIEEDILFAAKADMDDKGNFSEQWLVISKNEVAVFQQEGTKIYACQIKDIIKTSLMHAIGGGSLLVETKEESKVLVRFTSSFTKKFVIASQTIDSLVKGESLPVLAQKDRMRFCSTCKRPLHEGTDVCPKCVDKKKVVGRILQYAKPYRKQMVLASLLMVFGTLLTLAPPFITKIIVDDVLVEQKIGVSLLFLVVALGMTQILHACLDIARGFVGVWVGSKIMGDVRKDTYNSLMNLSLKYFDQRQTSQFIGRVNSDVEALRQFLTDGILWLVGQVLMLVAIIVVMVSLDWKLALLALIPAPIVLILSKIIWPYVRNRWYKQWQAINNLNMLIGDSLQGIRVVKAFGQEAKEKSRYEKGNHAVMDQTIRTDGMWQGIFPIFSLLTGAGALLVWYFGGQSVMGNEITLGTLMALIAYLGMLFGPLQWFSQAISWMSSAFAAADRIFEIMDTKPDVPNPKNGASLEELEGKVVLHNVTFGYESHIPTLKNINLEVKPGEMIGLVGHSGAGKSTLINLICRFYDPNQGEITLDGINLRDIKQERLHEQIGVVLQETFLFDGTVADNIAYSKPDATPEEIMRAAKIANAHDFIIKMEDGYDTKVGERGQRLSGGQKQRVAIARAILHNPKILILDEATASVDTETEKKIQEAISRLVKGRTTFAIAHRLSTLRNADRLVVIDKGEIAEIGSHDELMEKQGIYFKLVEAQREMSQIKGVSVG